MGKQAARVAERLRKALTQAPKALILEIDKELRKTTPVDTGNARANWVPSVGSPAPNGDRKAGSAAVLAYQLEQGPLFVSNGVPYITYLNNGSSKKAPALFVEAAVDEALARVRAKFGAAINIDREALISGMAGGVEYLGGLAADNLASAYSPFGGDDD